MIVGGDITCPRCQNKDLTQRVSLIAKQVQGTLTPAEIDSLMNQLSKGVAQERTKPNGGLTWEQLEKLFRFPTAPKLPWWVNPNRTTVRFGGFAATVFGFAFLYFFPTILPGVSLWVGIFVLLALVLFVGWQWNVGTDKARKAHGEAMVVWGKAHSNWTRTWYCARDNVIFVPPSLQTFAPDKISTLL